MNSQQAFFFALFCQYDTESLSISDQLQNLATLFQQHNYHYYMLSTMYHVNENGYYGAFGGAYVPEILHGPIEHLRTSYLDCLQAPDFQAEVDLLLRDYVGRPSPLYKADRLSERYGCTVYLKREDLNHTGAHKINNTIGQIVLAKRLGKTRIIAETGAGQHGVATATVCALNCVICWSVSLRHRKPPSASP